MWLLLESKPLFVESMTLSFDNERLLVDDERLLLEREPVEPPCVTTPARGASRAVVVGCFYP
jgi:hypothetical protein